jgi:DNA uptake protein ComE-like DNA-binding protein
MLLLKTPVVLLLAVVLLVASSPVSNYAAESTKKQAARMATIPMPTKIKPLDINSASIDQLKVLPGIHDDYARKIIDGRPYQKKDDLVLRKIISEATYNKIKERIITVNLRSN